tara:strand:- start:717 stop:1241 length:525 start_codon:yes stop_codon:yes gene_type:complete
MRIILQLIGLIILIPTVALSSLRYQYSDADGPSILFPGGELTSGPIYNGPEPDWSFTADIQTIELQLNESMSSRRVWAVPVNGRLYVVSGYMGSILGRIWKHWAVEAGDGDGAAVVRINGIRYPRRLVRIFQEGELDGVASVLSNKYDTPTTRQGIESGNTWVFQLAPSRGPTQ